MEATVFKIEGITKKCLTGLSSRPFIMAYVSSKG